MVTNNRIYILLLLLTRFLPVFIVKYLNVITDVAILRVPRDYYRNVWSSLSTITAVQKTPCSINVIHIGGTCTCTCCCYSNHLYIHEGTIKSCQKHLIKYNYEKLKNILDSMKTGGKHNHRLACVCYSYYYYCFSGTKEDAIKDQRSYKERLDNFKIMIVVNYQ